MFIKLYIQSFNYCSRYGSYNTFLFTPVNLFSNGIYLNLTVDFTMPLCFFDYDLTLIYNYI